MGIGPTRLGIAVSGGGDSMALLHLLKAWASPQTALFAVTVDHGLRPASGAEAAMVAEVCEGLAVPHTTLHWQGWDGTGNLQDRARRARYALMTDWALEHRIGAVALGHTMDDQAETFLMRLARGAGVDGLAAMAPRRRAAGIDWLRPMLGLTRQALRDWLRAGNLGWVEDPSNADPRFQRVRARQVLETLGPLGLDAGTILATTLRLAEARTALDAAASEASRRITKIEAGDVVIDRMGFLSLVPELRRRLLSHILAWVASSEYRPRHETLAEGLDAVEAGRGTTLHGCRLLVSRTSVRATRELQAVKGLVAAPAAVWDRRWRLIAPEGAETDGLSVRALGEAGLKACPDWRATGFPRVSLLAMPAVWRAGELVAAPLAGKPAGWCAKVAHEDAGELF